MVFFSCGQCGDSLKKPKVEKHLGRCQTNELTCIDCNKQFNRTSYDEHKSCVTENERYGDKNYEAKAGKGDDKQKKWMAKIVTAMEGASLSKGANGIWESLQEGGFDNVPRKQSKFMNFLRSSLNVRDNKASAEIWKVFESTFGERKAPPKSTKSKPAPIVASVPGKPWWEQFTSSSAEVKPTKSKKEESSSSSEDSDAEEVPKKKIKLDKIPKVATKKVASPVKIAESSSSSDDSAPVTPKITPKKKKLTKKPSTPVKPPTPSPSGSSESSSDEEPAKKVPAKKEEPAKKVQKTVLKKKVESSSSSESSDSEQKEKTIAPKVKSNTAPPQKKQESSSSSDSSESEDEKVPAKKVVVAKKVAVTKKVAKADSSSSSDSSESEDEKVPAKKVVVAKKVAVTKKVAKTDSSSSESGDDSSSDEEPAKMVPFAKKVTEKPAKSEVEPMSVDENYNEGHKTERQPKKEHSNKDSYNQDRDSRTVFIKNLPFNSTVDDLWEVFGKDEEVTIDCRFIMNRETGTHKGMGFVEYDSAEKAQEVINGKWKLCGRPVYCMQAGGKKPDNGAARGGAAPAGGNEKDRRTLFVKGLPFSATSESLVELFGCYEGRFLRDFNGKSKGMAFCEFESEADAHQVFSKTDGWELDGRWLIVDKLRPKGDANTSFKQEAKPYQPRAAFPSKPVGAATKNKGYTAGYEGKKTTFDD